jgi:hypothetical protein
MPGSMATLATIPIDVHANLLADVLSQADNLTTLIIEDPERLLDGNERLSSSMQGRSRLRRVKIARAASRAVHLVSGMHGVRELELQPVRRRFEPNISCSVFLRSLEDTLHSLDISLPSHEGEFDGILCPNVVELKIVTRQEVVPKWFHSFPSLRRLTIRAELLDRQDPQASWHPPWSKLDYLGGNTDGLCSLGMISPVRCVIVDNPSGTIPDAFSDNGLEDTFMDLLARTRPVALSVGYSSLRPASETRLVTRIVETQPQIECLHISVSSRDWASLMSSFVCLIMAHASRHH